MHQGVTAEMAGPRPPCDCHGDPMRWSQRRDLRAGGYWRCRKADSVSHAAWRERNKDSVREGMRVWQANNVEHRRQYQRRWRYGITQAEYDQRLAKQGGVCALCDGRPEDSVRGVLAVDHDHLTGAVRGLLCIRCNAALERAERPGWTERVSAYLGGVR